MGGSTAAVSVLAIDRLNAALPCGTMELSRPRQRGFVPMLLQTNSYVVPREKRVEHARLLRRFRQTLLRLGCDHFEVYEQTGANWSSGDNSGRFVQIMRFRDRKQQLSVQNAERADPAAQALLKEFCELINLPYQQQQGLFAVGFYTSFMRMPEFRPHAPGTAIEQAQDQAGQSDAASDSVPDAGKGNDPEAEAADTQSGFQTDDDSDYAEPGPIPTPPREQSEEAENPTFPSSS
jgi:hypothetical protein